MRLFGISSRPLLRTIALVFLAVILACWVKPSPDNVVRQYEKAVNSHSVEAVMRMYTDSIVFDVPSLLDVSGKEAMKGVSEQDSVLNTNLALANYLVKGDSVYCTVNETNDYLTAVGLSSAYYPRAVFVVKGDRISYIKAEMADSTAEKWNTALSEFMTWAGQNYPDEVAAMMPGGVFVHNAKNAASLMGLLREWKQASESESAD